MPECTRRRRPVFRRLTLLSPMTLAAVLACCAPALADSYRGTVTRVVDGDTLIVRYLEQHISVQLAGLDAPDPGEPYARRSLQSLADLCFDRRAKVVSSGDDPYGRVSGEVTCNGIDANEEQLRRGMARVDAAAGPVPAGWRALETQARIAGRGLWAGTGPSP